MDLLASLKKPEYIFHPTQIIRRLVCVLNPTPAGYQTVRLPWGLQIRIQPSESQGSCIRRLGIYDLASSEYISRLIDPGELAVDVGANIGHMTSLMAMRAASVGRVIAFEPHPVLFSELQYNISVWQQNTHSAHVAAYNLALSDYTGVAQLVVPFNFAENRGRSCLAGGSTQTSCQAAYQEVPVSSLDALIHEGERIGFLKIDVEGHELQVLHGAQRLMASGSIRDILFEEHRTIPTPVTDLLEHYGYAIYHVDAELFAPVVATIQAPYRRIARDAPNYLATRDANRAVARMSKRGWSVYSNQWHH
jgi:FkbM family methyltransferase